MKRYPSCILSTCVVPWDDDGNLIEDLFRDEVSALLAHGSDHLYIFGTAGEGYAVTDSQFDRIVQVFAEAMHAGQAEPMVGVVSLSLPIILERIDRARDLGVKQFQISLPSWGALTQQEVLEFFRQVCGRFRDCQFLHYNLMRSKRLVTPREYAWLMEEHPNLVATKNSTDALDRIEELIAVASPLQHFLNETGYAFGSLIGECGLLASIGLTNWNSCQKFFEAGQQRDLAVLLPLQQELNAIARDLMEVVGDTIHIDGAYDKLLWRLHDPRFPLRLLPPYRGLTNENFERFATLLREKYPNWAPG